MNRVGIIKGAFAPLLCSQLETIKLQRKQKGLDEVWFILEDVHEIAYVHRYQMLSRMLKPYRKLKIFHKKKLPQNVDFVQLEYQEIPFDFCLCWKDLSSSVKSYMLEHQVYLDRIAKSLVTEKRWIHVQSMTSLAVELARANHINEQDAYLAGMLHDCTKKWNYETSLRWMRFCAPEAINEAFPIHHQYTGAMFAQRVLKVRNQQVLHAILHHVKGDSKQALSQIIYLADKLDPSRDYDSSKEIALAKQDLNRAMEVVHSQQNAYLRKEGVVV